MARRKSDARRYEVAYHPSGRGWGKPIAHGFGDNLQNLKGRVAWHLAKGDYYPRALIVDRYNQKIVAKLYLTQQGHIHIEEF